MILNQKQSRRHIHPRVGFSLVEVTLTLGIVAFALVVLIGVLGNAFDAYSSVSERREGMYAVDALHQYLHDDKAFETEPSGRFGTIYSWAQADVASSQELAYVTYHSDATGQPDAESNSVRSIWLPEPFAQWETYSGAREGTWVKVRLTPADGPTDDGPNPMDLTDISSTAVDDYPHAYVVFQVDVFETAIPTQNLDDARPLFTTTIVARR